MKKYGLLPLVLLVCLLVAIGASAQSPVGYKKWYKGEGKYAAQIGGPIRNYKDAGTPWLDIENDWRIQDDTLYTNRRAMLKTDVNQVGQSTISLTMEGTTYTISQRLLKMIWINTQTNNWTDIEDVVWTATGGPIPASGNGARYAILTDDNGTQSAREVYAFWDLTSDRSVSDTQSLTLADLELRGSET